MQNTPVGRDGHMLGVDTVTATVADGQTVSGAVDLEDYTEIAVITPSGFTTGDIRFQASNILAGTYVPVLDGDNDRLRIKDAVASKCYVLPLEEIGEIMALRFLKLDCGAAQASGDDIILILKR